VTTFSGLLEAELRRDGSRPLVTHYDGASGDRTELSVATYATWVAKTASLLTEELDLEPGDRVLVDLPAHWLTVVLLGGVWAAGLEVVWEEPAECVVTGPDGIAGWAGRGDDVPVLATALLALGGRFPEPVPEGVHDLGVEIWSQPDVFLASAPAGDGDPAVAGTTHGELWRAAAAGVGPTGGGRLLSEANPASPSGLASLIEPLTGSGSLVLVTRAEPARVEQIASDERVTARFGQPTRS
jgi:uncharacterized protein (TIGR03089 family)